MSRIIIENRTAMIDAQAVSCALEIMLKGRISGKGREAQYCYHASLEVDGEPRLIYVSAFKNKASDRLVVHYNDGVNHAED